MASIHCDVASSSLVNRKLVNFAPEEYERIKSTLIQDIDVVARSFCETEITMLHALRTGQLLIGTLSDYKGDFCIYLEFMGTQVIKPIKVCH